MYLPPSVSLWITAVPIAIYIGITKKVPGDIDMCTDNATRSTEMVEADRQLELDTRSPSG